MGDGTDWHTPANWVGDELPGANDDVIIGPAFSSTAIVANNSWEIRTLKSAAPLTLNGSFYTLLSTGSRVDGQLLFPSGTLEVRGDLEIASLAEFGGEVRGSGTTTVVGGAELQFSDSALIGPNSTVVVDGVLTVQSPLLGNGSLVVNENGLLQKTGDGTATIQPNVTSAGSVQVDSGTIEFQDTVKATAGSISLGSSAQMVFAGQQNGHHELSVDSISGGSMTIKGGFDGRVEVLRADTFSTNVILDGGFLDPSTNFSIAELRVEAGGGEVLNSVSPPNALLTIGTLDVRGAANLSSGVVFQLDEVMIGDQGVLTLLQQSDPTIGRLSIADGTVAIQTSTVNVTEQLTVTGNATLQVGSSAQSISSEVMVDKLQIDPGGALNYELETASSKFETQTLVMSGNSLAGAGLVVQQQMNWNTGKLLPSGDQPGTTTIANGATALVQSATNLNQPVLDDHELINRGTLTIAGHSQFGQLSLKNSSKIENDGSLIFTNNASVDTSDNVVQPDASTITSGGTVRFSASSSTTIGTRFLSGGNVFVDGNAALRGGGFSDSGFTIAAGVTATIAGPAEFRFPNSAVSSVTGEGTLRIENQTRLEDGVGVFDVGLLVVAGGSFQVETNLALPRIDLLGGGIRVVGSTEHVLSVTDRLNWMVGFAQNVPIGGAGTTRIPVGATLVISGQGTAILEENARLLVEGTVDLQRGNLRARNIASIENAKGEFHVRDGAALYLQAGTSMSNDADFFKHGSHQISLAGVFDNTGTVNVLGGRLHLTGGGTSSGSILLEDDATLQFGQGTGYTLDHSAVDSRLEGGTVDVQALTTLTGPGAFAPNHLIVRNQFRIEGDISVPRVTATPFGNQFLGNGVISISQQLVADGLRFEEQVGLVIEDSATATFGPTFANYRSSRDIENHGTVVVESNISIESAITFLNQGTIKASGGAISGNSTPRATLVNEGTFVRSGDDLFTISTALDNSGTMNVLGGTLALRGGGSSDGRILLEDDATLQVGQGPAFSFNAGLLSGLDGGTVDVQTTVSVSGPGSFSPDRIDVRGTLTLNRDIRVPSVYLYRFGPQVNGTGTLFVSEFFNSNGGLIAGGASLEIDSGATATINSAILRTSGDLINRGKLNIPSGSVFFQTPSTGTLFNYGTIETPGGGTIEDQSAGNLGFVHNEGLILSSGGGQLNVTATVDNLGSIVAENSQINLQRQFVTNFQPATGSLNGGSWIVRQGGNQTAGISLHGITAVKRLAGGAELVLDGPPERAKFTNQASLDILGELEAITKGSRLELQGSRDLAPAGSSFDMQGTLVLGPGSTLDLAGNYVSATDSELTTQLGGAPETGLFGMLTAEGPAELAGTFNVEFADGFGPTQGQLFVPVTYSERIGDFATIEVPLLGSDRSLEVTRTNTEVQLSALVSASDLRVVSDTIKIPADATAGDLVTLEYSVENLSSTPAEGEWTDSLYLSLDDQLGAEDLLVTRITHTGGLAGLTEYREVIETTLPVGIDDSYRLIVVADSRGNVPDTDRRNNLGVSPDSLSIALQELVLGQTLTTTIARGESKAFKLVVPPESDVIVTADLAHKLQADLYLKFGDVPTRSFFPSAANYNLRANDPNTLQHQLSISGRSGDWYVLLYGRESADGIQPVSLTAAEAGLFIASVEPPLVRNVGQVTLTLEGFGFTGDSLVDLVDSLGNVVSSAESIRSRDSSHLSARFDFQGVAAGDYTLRIRQSGAEATRSMKVLDGGQPGEIQFEIHGPDRVRISPFGGQITVRYQNVGDTDIASTPIDFRDIGGSPASILTPPGYRPYPGETDYQVESLLLSNTEALQGGYLPPGAYADYELIFGVKQDMPSEPFLEFTVSTPFTELDEPYDWNAVKPDARPSWVPVDAWDVIFDNFVANIGPTLGHLRLAMAEAIAYLMEQGTPAERLTPDRIIGFLLSQTDNGLGAESVAASTDAYVEAPGTALAFSRYFPQSISGRFRQETGRFPIVPTALGRGWRHSYDYAIEDVDDENDTALVRTPTGYRHFEQLDRCPAEDLGGPLVQCTPPYREVGGSAILDIVQKTLIEPDGTILAFENEIFLPLKLTSIEQQIGNSITLQYTDDLLTDVVHSSGDRFTLEYNQDQRLNKLIDPFGRETVYSYDPAGEHLVSVVGPFGSWSYEYELKQIDSQHALTKVMRTDGSELNYAYDDQGRVHRVTESGAQPVEVMYDQGKITYRTSDDSEFSFYFNETGQVVGLEDANDQLTQLSYDDRSYLSQLRSPGDLVYDYTYSNDGLLSEVITPDGERISQLVRGQRIRTGTIVNAGRPVTVPVRELGGPFGIEKLTDQLGRNTGFQYESTSDFATLSTVTYPDSATEAFSGYDANGNLTQYENRRGQTIHWQYNERGQVVRQQRNDGSVEQYAYDERGNLVTASGPNGTLAFEYDARDRLIRASYPGNRELFYTYNALDQLASLADQDGRTTRYQYDASGRLARLEDAIGSLIVAYSYDSLGRLVREDRGNGTYTTYDLAINGELSTITHHAPDDSVLSQYAYQYDVLGRRTNMSTLDGTWDYAYDSIGQLRTAEFTSVNASIPDRTVQYFYDAAGNRTRTITDGVAEAYGVNNRNQYGQAGDATHSYDADGNLTFVDYTDPGRDDVRYSYDDLSRLVRVEAGSDVWNYEYDALGNRAATVHNGQRTEYVVEVQDLSDVVAEYANDGSLIAHYSHGLGLEAQTTASGEDAYYQFDALGSAIGLTDASGSFVNRYHYDPFGNPLVAPVEGIHNPFQYVGQLGVMQEDHGLQFMRARYYSPETGRFTSEDPIRHQGGINLFQYATNDPLNNSDPTGLNPFLRRTMVMLGQLRSEIIYASKEALRRGPAGVANEMKAYQAAHGAKFRPNSGTERLLRNEGVYGFAGPVLSLLGAPEFGFTLSLLTFVAFPNPATLLFLGVDTYFLSAKYPIFGDLFCDLVKCDEGGTLTDLLVDVVGSFDPNDITGPDGFGAENYKRQDDPFSYPYTIRFENLDQATAPAQRVLITQQLDDDLDWTTFQLRSFSFGDLLIDIPDGSSSFTQRIDATESLGVLVDFSAGVDMITGEATWEFTALDPTTLDLPIDPLAGFLPPNINAPEGQGSVSYYIEPKNGLVDGTQIDAEASIIFDTNAAIDTNVYVNRIDAVAPDSQVSPLPATTTTSTFTVDWSGQDGSGSGIASYDVFVSVNGGPFEPWLIETDLTTSDYVGINGNSYAFYSIAWDNVGYEESAPVNADTSTTVEVSGTTLDFGDAPTATQSGFAQDYPVTLAQDGARHVVGPLTLGSSVDAEGDGQPTATADGDGTDEDGIRLVTTLLRDTDDTGSSLLVNASAAGLLDAWIDFNADGDWDDAREQIFAGVTVEQGDNVLPLTIPGGAVAGATGARFRLSSLGGLSFVGGANDGEVEDYWITLVDGATSPTVSIEMTANDLDITTAAGHWVVTANSIERFRGAQSSVGSIEVSGTDTDDTIGLDVGSGVPSQGITVQGTVGNDTLVIRGDGGQLDLAATIIDVSSIERLDLSHADGTRVRLDTATVSKLDPTDRQIEIVTGEDDEIDVVSASDWRMTDPRIENNEFWVTATYQSVSAEQIAARTAHPWQNFLQTGDVNNDRLVTASDALAVINELADKDFIDSQGNLPDPISVANWPGYYYDKSGDNMATALDALQIINELAAKQAANISEPELIASYRDQPEEERRVVVELDAPTPEVSENSVKSFDLRAPWTADEPQVPAADSKTTLDPEAVDQLLAQTNALLGFTGDH